MSDPSEFNLWEWLLSSFRPFEVISGVATMAWVMSWLLQFPAPFLYITGTTAVVCLCVGIAGHIKANADRPTLTLGRFADELNQRQPQQINGDGFHPKRLPEKQEDTRDRHVSIEEIEEEYELKKLEPNFMDFGNEYVTAHDDDQGVIVRGESPGSNSFSVLVRSFGNEHRLNKVKAVKSVSFGLDFICFDVATRRKPMGPKIHRGAWLTEAETEVDFPANCPPRRAIIATVEGTDNRVYAIRRDSDSSYKNILPLREELTGSIYTVITSLRIGSQKSKAFQYILEIVREPSFELRLNSAYFWKSTHLLNFIEEGYNFAKKIHEIWEDATSQTPLPEGTEPKIVFNISNRLFQHSWSQPNISELWARRAAIEREQEEKILEPLKDWESRAADWVDLFIGGDAKDKIINKGPSFEAGLNRQQKSAMQRLGPPTLRGKTPPPPPLPYWTLSDAVSSRIDALTKLREQLQ